MNLTDKEATIQQIAAEFYLAPTEWGKQKVLNAWRAKLGKEPTSLPSFRIDSIVREVRKRLIGTSQ
jgi:hypothetical protein